MSSQDVGEDTPAVPAALEVTEPRRASVEIVRRQVKGLVEVTDDGEPLYRHRKTIFGVVCWSWFIMGIPHAAFNSAIGNIELDINMGSSTSGLIVGIPGIVAAVSGFIVLYFGEKVSIRAVISLAIVSGGCHYVLVALCTEPWHFFIILPLRAFSYLFLISAPVLLDHMSPNKKRGFRVQLMFAGGAFGLAVGYTLGAGMLEHWKILQAVCGTVLIINGMGCYLLLKSADIHLLLHDDWEDPFIDVVKTLLTKRGYVMTVLMASGIWSPVQGWSVYFVKWANDRFYGGEDEDTPATILGATIILACFYSVLGGWSVDKYVARNKLKYGDSDTRLRLNSTLQFLMAFYIPCVIVAPFVFIQDNDTVFWILLEILFFFMSVNPFTQGHLWGARHGDRDLPGLTVLALSYLINQAMDGTMILLVGYLLDHTTRKAAFGLPTIWTVLMLCVSALIFVQRQKALGYPIFSLEKKGKNMEEDHSPNNRVIKF